MSVVGDEDYIYVAERFHAVANGGVVIYNDKAKQ